MATHLQVLCAKEICYRSKLLGQFFQSGGRATGAAQRACMQWLLGWSERAVLAGAEGGGRRPCRVGGCSGCARWRPAGKTLPIVRGEGLGQPIMGVVAAEVADGRWLHLFPEGKVRCVCLHACVRARVSVCALVGWL